MKPSDFLPSFFRQVKRTVIPGQYGVEDNLLSPDQKPVVAPAIAPTITPAPTPTIAPNVPKVSIPYEVPMPDSDMPPLASPTNSVNGAAISNDVARSMGHVTSSKSGRPTPLPSELDPASEEKTLAVNKAYQTYDPEAQPATGWHKWVPTMISGAVRGFGAGGVGGAIFGGAEGGFGGATDPARANREWQQKKLGETGPVVAGIQKQRKIQADIEEQQAQTEQRRAAPGIAAAEIGRKRDYDNERLQIQRDAEAGRISSEQARIKNSDLDRKQRAEEGRLNREAQIKAAQIRANASDTKTADKSAENEAKRVALLKEAEDTKKNAEIYEGNADTNEKLADQFQVKDDDKNLIDSPRAKELRKLAGEQRDEARRLRAKIPGLTSDAGSIPQNGSSAGKLAPTTHSFSIGAYIKRNKGATEADARAYAKQNYPNYDIAP